jgi:integrase
MTHEKVSDGLSKASTVSAPCPQKLNEDTIESLPVPESGHRIHYFPEAIVHGVKVPRGFGVRVTAAGARTFVLRRRVRGAGHADRTVKVGRWPDWKVLAAIKKARLIRDQLEQGKDPIAQDRAAKVAAIAAAGDRFEAIADNYLAREGGKLRSAAWRKRQLERLVYPTLGARAIGDIKRSDIVKLLDTIEKDNGATMATATLAIVRKIFNWHATRSDDFRSPIVRGMARTKSRDQARARILTDAEIRALWKHADEVTGADALFGRFMKFLMLTGARRGEAAHMTWPELDGTDWTLPASRNKAKFDLVRPLSKATLAILPVKTEGCEFIFTTDGKRPIGGFSQFKSRVDDAIGVADWTLHDLRRTARSLMSRAGVQGDHAEQCLGHIIPGVRGVYDRHEYRREKAEAYEALALLIERILNPAPANVTQLRTGA